MNDIYSFSPVAFVRSPYPQKFAIPRQPGLNSAVCRIEFLPDYPEACFRGLEDFGMIWVQFVFHGTADEGWQPTVRPPRLGGREKKGVFATRSPHRPNPLGLSLLALEGIEYGRRVALLCRGADLLDGTPVLDVKPYLPFVEARPEAAAGFAAAAPPLLQVVWQTPCPPDLPAPLLRLIEESIAQDPRPAYQNRPERVYAASIGGWNIRFRIVGQQAEILSVQQAA